MRGTMADMRFRKLRIAWLVMCMAIAMWLVWLKEFTYPKLDEFALPSVAILIALTAFTWLPWRPRNLLVAMTLLAVVLGLAVWASH
jgi:hypothetical protein